MKEELDSRKGAKLLFVCSAPGAERYPSYSISRMSALSTRAALIERFTAAYRELAIQAPGVTPEHLADAILAAAGNGAARPWLVGPPQA
jgi:hypothetical protein